MSIQLEFGYALEEQSVKAVSQALHPGNILTHRAHGDIRRLSQPDNAGRVFRPWSESVLMASSSQERFDVCSVPDEQRADPFRGVELVPSHRQKVDARSLHIDLQLTD